MNLDTFLETAWNDHADHPREVADRLPAALSLLQKPADIVPFARLAVHVHGEHLGEWERGIALLDRLRALDVFDGGTAAAGAIVRGRATLRYAGGDAAALEGLLPEDRVVVLATASVMIAGRDDFPAAIAMLEQALAGTDDGWPDASPAVRALAIAGNNLAAALEERRERDAAQTRAMVLAAETGLRYWQRAGTWLEHERALHRLAHSRLQAGDAAAAMAAARECVAVCAANAAPPFETFFGHAVHALAARAAGDAKGFADARAAALQCYAEVPADDQRWCAGDLAAMERASTPAPG